ncbi:MAG: aminopeptidase P family protein [Acidimicrobiia bacterium]|nr:aminopeptidase P family protein [Acidimicrobiia bacterium]
MTTFDYPSRLGRARALMAERGIDVLLLSVGADLPYLTGYRAMPLERLTMLVLPGDGPAVLVVPALEAPRVTPRPDAFVLEAWEETEDPVALVAARCGAARRLAVGDTTWAVFLLALQERLPDAAFTPASTVTGELRLRKEAAEVDLLRRAGAAVDRVVARLDGARFSGKTERQLAAEVAAMVVEEGHEASAFSIVASGPNGASPHHESGDRVISPGDAVVLDFGGRLQGYHSDITRTFFVGDPPPRFREVFAAVQAAQEAGVAAAGPGVPAQEVDRAARGVIAAAGFGPFFMHRTGHGIGLEEHEAPYIVEGNTALLEPGVAFSVEPGIYLPGEFGVRIEDCLVVTGEGAERFNRAPRDIHFAV